MEILRTSSSASIPSLEQLELQMQLLNAISDSDKQLWHFIFLQIKREIKNKNLNVSSGSILPLLEALRSSQPPSVDTRQKEKIVAQVNVSLANTLKITET